MNILFKFDQTYANQLDRLVIKRFTMGLHSFIRQMGINDVKAFGLDTSNVIEEKIPIVIAREEKKRIQRLQR